MNRIGLGVSIVCVVCGCAGEPLAETHVTVRDSLGIRIVESVEQEWHSGEGWTISTTPSLDIGVVEGAAEYQFQYLRGATRLSDGSIVVGDGSSSELRKFDSAGRFVWKSGRDGEGPGEFKNLGWLQPLGTDSLVAYDRSLRRVSVFDNYGRLGRTANVDQPGNSARPSAIGVMGDGSIIVSAIPMISPSTASEGINQLRGLMFKYSPGGDTRDTIVEFLGEEWLANSEGSGRALMMLPFGKGAAAAVSSTHLCLGNTRAFELTLYSSSGRPEAIFRLLRPSRPVTPEVIDRYKSERLDRTTSDAERQLVARRLETVQFSETIPAFGSILIDTEGNIWLQDYLAPGETELTYSVFAAEGQFLGTVVIPSGLRVYEIGDDYVLGRWRDELDVEHVRLYALQKSRGE